MNLSSRNLRITMNINSESGTQHTINTLGEILEEFIRHEKVKIAEYEAEGFEIRHGPTIGDIYEGLTSAILNHALPSSLNLRVTGGFVSGKDNKTSGQIDCMLVKGTGRRIPNTDHEIVRIEDVLVVFEVKKTLYGSELPDILEHFDQLMELDREHFDDIDTESIFKLFSQTCGISIQDHSDAMNLPWHQKLIYCALVCEHTHPVRIAISYDGFKSESNFRKSFVAMIKGNEGKKWIHPKSWPDLIISGDYSMVKMNGRPYTAPSNGSAWNVYGTTRVSPVRLLLELVYTKIAAEVEDGMWNFWGEDLEIELISRFLTAEAAEENGLQGWNWEFVEFTESELEATAQMIKWEPFFADKVDFGAFMLLCETPDGVDISELVQAIGDRAFDLVDRLKRSGLVAQSGTKIELTTKQASGGFLPSGRFFFGEDNTGRITRWAHNQTKLIRDRVNADAQVSESTSNTTES